MALRTKTRHVLVAMPLILAATFGLEATFVGKTMAGDNKKTSGVAEMSATGVLTIRMFDAPKGADTQVINPTDSAYQDTINYIGGIKPGERKSILRSVGQVTMNADRTLSYSLTADVRGGGQAISTGTSKPGDANYQPFIDRVGGLKPGETKPIP